MTGAGLKQARLAAGLTQLAAARQLGLSQPYLSQLERGRRAVTPGLARAAAKRYRLPPTSLAAPPDFREGGDPRRLPNQLAALGYPGYAHLRKSPPVNPAVVVFDALSDENLDGRVAEALPWVLARFPDLDWTWLLDRVRRHDFQNRLGFLVTVARTLAEKGTDRAAAAKLGRVHDELERARLVAETTLGRAAMPAAEREWLREHRSPEARHWNVLSGLSVRELPYA